MKKEEGKGINEKGKGQEGKEKDGRGRGGPFERTPYPPPGDVFSRGVSALRVNI